MTNPRPSKADASTKALPFLKWAGGKQWLVEQGVPLPQLASDATYYEPFLGGGSLFFAVGPGRAVLSDSNSDLITTYRAVRDNVEAVISLLSSLQNNAASFAAIRASRPSGRIERAARFIYLNRTAFNGIYRVNRAGEFNVPYGKYVNRSVCPEERLRMASTALRGSQLRTSHFTATVRSAKRGDIIYFDPPYVTGHNNNGFIKYNAHLFDWRDQMRLASLAASLRDRGAYVIVSNAAHDAVLRLYKGFAIDIRERHSLIAARARDRGVVQEAVITSFKPTRNQATSGITRT